MDVIPILASDIAASTGTIKDGVMATTAQLITAQQGYNGIRRIQCTHLGKNIPGDWLYIKPYRF